MPEIRPFTLWARRVGLAFIDILALLRAFTDGFHGGAACCGFCDLSLQLCAQMGAFQSVDEDALDKAACWLKKEDLLRVRELSPHGRDAARRAIARKWIPDIRLVYFGHQQYVGDSALEMRAPPPRPLRRPARTHS